jgi:cyclophilin family peptidyl-prolyl cis-trans isomerase
MITLADKKMDWLDGKHGIFGKVVEGLDVLSQINQSLGDEKHRPYRDIMYAT